MDRGSPCFCRQAFQGWLFLRLRRIGSKVFCGIRLDREFTTTETNKGNQMRENLSLLSYWGVIFTLIAVTLFVVVYIYMSNTGKGEDRDMVEYLRRRSVATYLAAASSTNEDISSKLRAAADEIERLRAQNYVLFWLIIAMNAVVASLFAIAYKNF
jgi:cytochrome bd-type quinol oxidase subunit 2